MEKRVCTKCGNVMREGYYLGGEYACSYECAVALYGGDIAQMEEDLNDGSDECYYTVWE